LLNFKIIPVLWKSKYDYVIIEGYHSISLLLAILTAKLSKKKVALRTEAYLDKSKPVLVRYFKEIYLRLVLPLFDLIFYSSDSAKKYYIHYGVKHNILVFVPAAVDNDFFRKQINILGNSQDTIRNKLAISKTTVIILGVGRITNRKNWKELIDAFNVLRSKCNVALIIVGDGPDKKRLIEYVKLNKIGKVYFVGFKNQTEISPYYHTSDIFALTSKYDPSPKVLNEALNFGLPLV
ncbi:unnamed protein product, partial [marine sediment metagenome]